MHLCTLTCFHHQHVTASHCLLFNACQKCDSGKEKKSWCCVSVGGGSGGRHRLLARIAAVTHSGALWYKQYNEVQLWFYVLGAHRCWSMIHACRSSSRHWCAACVTLHMEMFIVMKLLKMSDFESWRFCCLFIFDGQKSGVHVGHRETGINN